MNDLNYVLLSGEVESNVIAVTGGTAEFRLSVAHHERGEVEPVKESYLISAVGPSAGACVRNLRMGMSIRVVGCLRISPVGEVYVRTDYIEIKAQ